jgi:uncharacterized surface protein with fasciclin (FAS1) repeats
MPSTERRTCLQRTSLQTLMGAAGLTSTVNQDLPFTLFAPTDS